MGKMFNFTHLSFSVFSFSVFLFISTVSISTAQELFYIDDFHDRVYDTEFSPDGSKVLIGSLDGTTQLRDVVTGAILQSYTITPGSVYDVDFTSDGSHYLISGRYRELGSNRSTDGFLGIFDANTGEKLREFDIFSDTAAFSPDGSRIAVRNFGENSEIDRVLIVDALTGETIGVLSGHEDGIGVYFHGIDFSPDGRYIATAGFGDLTAIIWDAVTFEPVQEIQVQSFDPEINASRELTSVAFTPDSKQLITQERRTGTIRSWDVESGQELITYSGFNIRSLQFKLSRDGKYLVSFGTSGVILWDTSTGARLVNLLGVLDAQQFFGANQGGITTLINAVDISPDNTKLIVGRHDGSASLYEIEEALDAIEPGYVHPSSGMRVVYDNPLDGIDKTAEDHGLTVIPGGFSNAGTEGVPNFGNFIRIFTRVETTPPADDFRFSNFEGLSSTLGTGDVTVILGEAVEVNNPALFRMYVVANENIAVTVGLIDPEYPALTAFSSWEHIPAENNVRRSFSEWHLHHVFFESKSGKVQPVIQIASSSQEEHFGSVFIDNLRIYEVPKNNADIRVLLDYDILKSSAEIREERRNQP